MESAGPLFFIALWGFMFFVAIATALMEIQIEGGNGWAGCLPAWRFAPSWMRSILNGKDVTGYHTYLNLHMILLFHFPLLFTGWSWMMEMTILSMLAGCMVLEDALWFMLNPHFGWQSFGKTKISWYAKWVGPFPVDYYFWMTVSGCFAWLRGSFPGAMGDTQLLPLSIPLQHFIGWAIGFFCVMVITIALNFFMTRRIARFLSQDTIGHPGHPGVCNICSKELPAHLLKSFNKKVKRSSFS